MNSLPLLPAPKSRRSLLTMLVCLGLTLTAPAQTKAVWRTATLSELEAVLPSRAPVERERIETEMRTATGIVNDRGQLIAAVVLITAGYAADGKYSHFLLLQAPLQIADRALAPGNYVVGWSRTDEGLAVHIFDAASGVERLTSVAKPIPNSRRVESFHIWPPSEHSMIQIGRYMLPYTLRP